MGIPEKRCDWCGKTSRYWQFAPYGGTFCSRSCMMAARADTGLLVSLIILIVTLVNWVISPLSGLIMLFPLVLIFAYTYLGYYYRSSIVPELWKEDIGR